MTVDYDAPVAIAEGIYWVGFFDPQSGLHCNPYLIVDGDEAVLIDAGSRPDFPVVMSKILETGTDPGSIRALVFQHYDPDLCGSISSFEEIIARDDLEIISPRDNHMFIRHYQCRSRMVAPEDGDGGYEFSSGRRLRFTMTPYCHAPGSMVTLDETSGVLFTSDLFGSYGHDWQLFLDLRPQCLDCPDYGDCPERRASCPILDVLAFHRRIMPATRALRFALERMADLPFTCIAPQHGSVIRRAEDIALIYDVLNRDDRIGIDALAAEIEAEAGACDAGSRVRQRLMAR